MTVQNGIITFVLGVVLIIMQAPAWAQQGMSSNGNGANKAVALTQDQIRELIRHVAENDIANNQKARNYTYIERAVQRKLNGDESVKSTEVKTYEVMQLYGEQVRRLIEKDDKPLSEKEAGKEEEKIQKLIKKRSNESEGDRKKRLDKEAKEQEEAHRWVTEICDAYNFRVSGTEKLQGRELTIIDGDPKPDYQPKLKDAKYLVKFRLRGWIDRQAEQWVKMDAEAIDDLSWGAFLVKINKGTRFEILQTLVNDEVWLPQNFSLKVSGRALFKGLNLEFETVFRDYKKFRTDVKISEPKEVSEYR